MSKKIIGIYSIQNRITQQRYIGKSIDILHRWRQHQQCLQKGIHGNNRLQNSYNKYGDVFDYTILEECCRENLSEREIYWISYYDSRKTGYNLTDGGDGTIGRIYSEETRNKLSQAAKNRPHKPHTEETKRKMSESAKGENNSQYNVHRTGEDAPFFGHHHSEETRHKMSEDRKGEKGSFYGKKHSKESLEKMSECKKGENNPMYGRHITLSDEAKEKISKANKGKCAGAKNGRARKVQASTGEVFNCLKDAASWCNLTNAKGISKCCQGKIQEYGAHPITGEKLSWIYVNDK